MCFHIEISSSLEQIQNRFNANISTITTNFKTGYFSAFTFPYIPVITNKNPKEIQFFRWGLIPHWSKNEDIKNYTLNAKIETINEKPSFKYYTQNRCLVVVDGFYEWKWLDPSGKKKEKYFITVDDSLNKPFALGGLFNIWINPITKEEVPTFTILTMEALGIMEEIHNSKKRMPFILHQEIEKEWLEGKVNPYRDVPLIAYKV